MIEPTFDVFLCHNSRDKFAVKKIAGRLRKRGLRPWLDIWELRPGLPWQPALEAQIQTIRAAAVFVGPTGRGPWQDQELQAFLSQFVKRGCPVIPVILPDCEDVPDLPSFLGNMTRVDFRVEHPDPLDQLVWGITGKKPESEDQATFTDQEAQSLSAQLDDLYARREQLTIDGEDTRELEAKILDVRSRLRKGPQLQPGEFLLDGRFRIVEKLGQGGFATVWKAYDRHLRRLVAVKVLHGQHSEDRTRRERFFRGARQMAELPHPNIVQVLEPKLRDEGWLFFVMEIVSGGDFNQAVLGGELTDDEKLDIVSQVGEALEYAHQRGLIHRDVKPANILLDNDRRPKLTDFDLVVAEGSRFTQTRAILGTLNYAAPEALESAKEAGPPADVYSLASTAIFALMGKPLPRGYYRDPVSAITNLKFPPALAQVLTRATVPDPKQRFPSVAAFVSALKETKPIEETTMAIKEKPAAGRPPERPPPVVAPTTPTITPEQIPARPTRRTPEKAGTTVRRSVWVGSGVMMLMFVVVTVWWGQIDDWWTTESSGSFKATLTPTDDRLTVSQFVDLGPTPGDVALCMSGGGSRALTAGMGQLRALKHLTTKPGGPSLLGQARVLSTVSGGSWLGVTFEYLTPGTSDDDYLNRYVADPGRLVPTKTEGHDLAETLDELPEGNIGEPISSRLFGPLELAFQVLLLREFSDVPMPFLWQAVVGFHILKPYGLYDPGEDFLPTTFFTYDQKTLDAIIAANPQLKREDAHLVASDSWRVRRPFLVCNAGMFVKIPGKDFELLAPVEATSFMTGIVGKPEGTDANGKRPGGGGRCQDSCRMNLEILLSADNAMRSSTKNTLRGAGYNILLSSAAQKTERQAQSPHGSRQARA